MVLKVPAFTEVVELTLFRDGVGTQYKIPTEFEGILGQVTELSSGPIRRSVAGGVIDGKFYMFGGVLSNSSPVDGLNDMWVYDPQDDVWTEIQQIDPPDIRHGAASAVVDNKLYVAGGIIKLGTLSNLHYRDLHVYDPLTNEWTELATPPEDANIGLLAPHGEYIYTWVTEDETMWRYNLHTNAWESIEVIGGGGSSTLSISASHTIGDSIYAHTGVRSITRFDINTREFTEVEQSLRVRHFYAAVTIGNAIAVQGGRPAPTHSPIGLLDLYDPKTNTWENIPLSSNDVRRFEHFMFRIGSKLYVYGGRSQLLHQTNTGTLFEIV